MINSIQELWEMMSERGMPVPEEGVRICIPEARFLMFEILKDYFQRVGQEFQIEPVREQYTQVADWLCDNECKGLFLYGQHGLGKTVLAKFVIPGVLLAGQGLIANFYLSTQMRSSINEILSKKIIVIDDIGVESQAVEYGNRRNLMDEIMDDVEQNHKLIILTTNLDADGLIQKYGAGTFDRICATTKRIPFEGKSFRR